MGCGESNSSLFWFFWQKWMILRVIRNMVYDEMKTKTNKQTKKCLKQRRKWKLFNCFGLLNCLSFYFNLVVFADRKTKNAHTQHIFSAKCVIARLFYRQTKGAILFFFFLFFHRPAIILNNQMKTNAFDCWTTGKILLFGVLTILLRLGVLFFIILHFVPFRCSFR